MAQEHHPREPESHTQDAEPTRELGTTSSGPSPIAGGPPTQSVTAAVIVPGATNPADSEGALSQGPKLDFEALAALAARSKQVAEGLALARQVREWETQVEAQQLEHFRQVTEAIIAAKARDPDELERREAARHRRGLMTIVGVSGLLFCGGALGVGLQGGSLMVFVALAALSVLCLSYTALLASGGTLTARSVQSIIKAVLGRTLYRHMQPGSGDTTVGPRRRRRTQRRKS